MPVHAFCGYDGVAAALMTGMVCSADNDHDGDGGGSGSSCGCHRSRWQDQLRVGSRTVKDLVCSITSIGLITSAISYRHQSTFVHLSFRGFLNPENRKKKTRNIGTVTWELMYLCPVFRKPSNSIWYRNLRNLLSLTVATFSKEKIFVTFYMTREKNKTTQNRVRVVLALHCKKSVRQRHNLLPSYQWLPLGSTSWGCSNADVPVQTCAEQARSRSSTTCTSFRCKPSISSFFSNRNFTNIVTVIWKVSTSSRAGLRNLRNSQNLSSTWVQCRQAIFFFLGTLL